MVPIPFLGGHTKTTSTNGKDLGILYCFSGTRGAMSLFFGSSLFNFKMKVWGVFFLRRLMALGIGIAQVDVNAKYPLVKSHPEIYYNHCM